MLLRVMLIRVTGLIPQSRNTSALYALRRLSSIASALGHHKERIPDNVSTCGDVDACSRALRAIKKYKFFIRKTDFIRFIIKLGYISIDLKKVKAIVSWQELENII